MCERCRYLDGGSAGKWAVIGAIRTMSAPPTTYEIASEAGLSVSNTLHILKRLKQAGRVRVVGRNTPGQTMRYALDEAGI